MQILYWQAAEAIRNISATVTKVALDEWRPGRGPLAVLLPTTKVLLTRGFVPGKASARMLQALPYALEEHVLDDVDALHFAAGPRDAQGYFPTAVIARTDLESCLNLLQAAELSPRLILPDVLAVPRPSNGWSILLGGQYVLVRTGDYSGFAIEHENLAEWLSLAFREKSLQVPECLWVLRDEQQPAGVVKPAMVQGIELIERSHPQHHLCWLQDGLLSAQKLNLLQGDYQPRSQSSAYWKPWRLSAALGLLWLSVVMLQLGADVQSLRAERNQLNQAMTQLYRQTFPQAQRIVAPRTQMEQQLRSLQQTQGTDQADFLSLLVKSASALNKGAGVVMKRLEYRNTYLDLECDLPSVQALESMQQQLQQAGLKVEVRHASSRNNQVETRLRLQEQR